MRNGKIINSRFLAFAVIAGAVFFVAPAVFGQISKTVTTQPTEAPTKSVTTDTAKTAAPTTQTQTIKAVSPTTGAVAPATEKTSVPLAPPALPAPTEPAKTIAPAPVKSAVPAPRPTNVTTGQFTGTVYPAADVQFLGINLSRMAEIARELGDEVTAVPVLVRVGQNTKINASVSPDGEFSFSVASEEENLAVTWRILGNEGAVLVRASGLKFSIDTAERDVVSEAVVASIVAGQLTAPIFALPEIERPIAELPPVEIPEAEEKPRAEIPKGELPAEEVLPEEEAPEEAPEAEEVAEARPEEEIVPEAVPEEEAEAEAVTFFEQFTDTAEDVVEGIADVVEGATDFVLDLFGIGEVPEEPTEAELIFAELPPLDISVREEELTAEEFAELGEAFAAAEEAAEEAAAEEEARAIAGEETIDAEIEFEELAPEEELILAPAVPGAPGISEPLGDIIIESVGPGAPEKAPSEAPTFFETLFDIFGFDEEEVAAEEAEAALVFNSDFLNPIPVAAIGRALTLDLSAEEELRSFGSIDEAALILDRQGTVERIDGAVRGSSVVFEFPDDTVSALLGGTADASAQFTIAADAGDITFIYYLGSVSAEEAAL